jgi:phage protein D
VAIPVIETTVSGLLSARYANGSLVVGGIDLLLGLASQSILGFAFTDNTSDQADDLTIQIADPDRTWMQIYLPKKGIECSATIQVYNWLTLGDSRSIDCGIFWIDQIDCNGPPNVITVQAVSIPISSGIKNEKRWRGWEGTSLQLIASQIATENGLTLVWDTPQMPKLERVDEVGSPDLEFLRDKVKESSLSLSVKRGQLVIFSEEEYEARAAVYTINYGTSNILGYAFSSKLNDTYKEAEVAYVSPKTGEYLKEGFSAPNPPEGTNAIDRSSERVEEEGEGGGGAELRDFTGPINAGSSGSADAKRKAKANLREKNKKEKMCEMVVFGNPDYRSGLNVQLSGFGIFDGKWFIYSSSHEISENGYTTQLSMRATLDGY